MALCLALLPLAATPVSASFDDYAVAILQGLDKITARISTIEAPVGRSVYLGTLEITARACRKRPPEETPESAVFLEIAEVRPEEPSTPLFRGWMFASSPALSALEHPIYDVWLVDCQTVTSPDRNGSR